MADLRHKTSFGGRLLAYADETSIAVAHPSTGSDMNSGMVVAKTHAPAEVRRLRDQGYGNPLVVDVCAWKKQDATVSSPMDLPPGEGLFPITLEDWSEGVLSSGASDVLSPSKFVSASDWPALKAVLTMGDSVDLPGFVTLVATDAAMLDESNFHKFLASLCEARRPLAVVFAASRAPLSVKRRMKSVRKLVDTLPSALLLGVDALAGLDTVARGGAAAIGVTGGLRRPRRPTDTGGGGFAAGGLPGLLLRDLWEQRSPQTYADWYANKPSPRCDLCGGRASDVFGNSNEEKHQILLHNLHTWMRVFSEMRDLETAARIAWLSEGRRNGLIAHASLRPAQVAREADPLLQQLVALDDPNFRIPAPTHGRP
jgi:hypothetical protein